jgi:hypothetical protein
VTILNQLAKRNTRLPASADLPDWRTDSRLINHQQRLATCCEKLPGLERAAGNAAQALHEAEQALDHAETFLLADRGDQQAVNVARTAFEAAKKAEARARVDYEECKREHRLLSDGEAMLTLEIKRETAQKLSEAYLAHLEVFKDALTEAVSANEALRAIYSILNVQYPPLHALEDQTKPDTFRAALGALSWPWQDLRQRRTEDGVGIDTVYARWCDAYEEFKRQRVELAKPMNVARL